MGGNGRDRDRVGWGTRNSHRAYVSRGVGGRGDTPVAFRGQQCTCVGESQHVGSGGGSIKQAMHHSTALIWN